MDKILGSRSLHIRNNGILCHCVRSHIIFQICAGTLCVLPLLPEMRRWGKNFENGTSCDDQKPGVMQPELQKNVTLVSQSLSHLCWSTGRHFQKLQLQLCLSRFEIIKFCKKTSERVLFSTCGLIHLFPAVLLRTRTFSIRTRHDIRQTRRHQASEAEKPQNCVGTISHHTA